MNTTPEEDKAIRALKRVAKIWPNSLWLFSASGELEVMKKNSLGQKVHVNNGAGEGIDQGYIVDRIDIENDGGDW